MSEGVLQKPTELDRKEREFGHGVPRQFRKVHTHTHINLPNGLLIM